MPIPISAAPRVLILGDDKPTPALDKLKSLAHVHFLPYVPAEQTSVVLQQTIAEAGPFIAFGANFEIGRSFPPNWNESYLSPLFPDCKLIVTPGAGYDRVDVDYLSSVGCLFANTPFTVGTRTADGAVMLLLAAMRGLTPQDLSVRAGTWRDPNVKSKNWRECTLGIVGMGNIGRQIADSARALGFARVLYTNRRPKVDTPYEFVSLDTLLGESDAVVLACPLTPDTHHLLDADALRKLKRGSIVVNVSRGAVIDEPALVEALETGHVMRAALDVFEHEPKVHPGLQNNPNVTLSPHNAAGADGMAAGMNAEVIESVVKYLETGLPTSPINAASVAAQV